jgi:hypothetical protein
LKAGEIADGTRHASSVDMNPHHIDFISAYCDRWCERCPMTQRCSVFTAEAAITMCGGDDRAGLDLAFGRAPDDDGDVQPVPDWMPEEEARAWERRHRDRRRRVEATPIMQMAEAYMHIAHAWRRTNEKLESAADVVVREAFRIVAYDLIFIRVKLHRALDGKDCFGTEDDFLDDGPVQNDWNGSAKVALISIERSAEAWRVLASATGQETPGVLADQLRDLRAQVEREFPDAWRFLRPGFDEG